MEEGEKKKLNSFFTLLGGVMFGDVKKVKEILDQGESVNVRFVDLEYKDGKIADSPIIAETDTPLLVAVKSSANPEVIRLLLERGADVTAKDENGKTALELIKERNLNDVVKMLETHSLNN